jgi:hypothetical protein
VTNSAGGTTAKEKKEIYLPLYKFIYHLNIEGFNLNIFINNEKKHLQ